MGTADAADPLGALLEVGLSAVEAMRLKAWLDLLAQWNRRVNLTGLPTDTERLHHLVGPVLRLRELPAPGRLLDIGSGNGSPGLIWAALRPDVRVTLLEPRLKRWAFLREAARAIGRPDTMILRERHDEYQGPAAQTVSLRALALPLRELTRLLEPGGRLVVFGANPSPEASWETLDQPQPGVRVLGLASRSVGGASD